MEKEELKKKLIKLKKDLAKKRMKLQKCEHLVEVQHHAGEVQQSRNERLKIKSTSAQITCKVTFERLMIQESRINSNLEKRKKVVKGTTYAADQMPKNDLCDSSRLSRPANISFNHEEEYLQAKNSDKGVTADVKLSGSSFKKKVSSDDKLNRADVIYSNDISPLQNDNKIPAGSLVTSDVTLSQEINEKTTKFPPICSSGDKQKSRDGAIFDCGDNVFPRYHDNYSGKSENIDNRVNTYSNEMPHLNDCNNVPQNLHTVGGVSDQVPTELGETHIKEDLEFRDKSITHENEGCTYAKCSDTTVMDPDVKQRACVLGEDYQCSDNLQNMAFTPQTCSQSLDSLYFSDPNQQENSEYTTKMDCGERTALNIYDNIQNLSSSADVPTGRPGEDEGHNKQLHFTKKSKRGTEIKSLDCSALEYDQDMYSQVKSRTRRHIQDQSDVSWLTILPLKTTRARQIHSLTANSSEIKRNSKSKVSKRRIHSNANKMCQKMFTFPPLSDKYNSKVLDFVLPKSDFEGFLLDKINSCRSVVYKNIGSETDPFMNCTVSSADLEGLSTDIGDSCTSSNKMNEGNDDTSDPVIIYHSCIKFQYNEPVLDLQCDVSENASPQEILTCCTPFRMLVWIRKGSGWIVAREWTLAQLQIECLLRCQISSCHKWVYIWSTVQCFTQLIAASVEHGSQHLQVVWKSKQLCTATEKYYYLTLDISSLIIGSVTPAHKTKLIKVILSDKMTDQVREGDLKSRQMEVVHDKLVTLVTVEGLPEAVLGIALSSLYVWNHVSGKLVHTVAIQDEILSCPFVYHHQGLLILPIITKTSSVAHVLAVNPVNGKSCQLHPLETVYKNKYKRLIGLSGTDKLLCGWYENSIFRLWSTCTGQLVAYSRKRITTALINICRKRLLIFKGKLIIVYKI